jgi:hypothetical protein
MKNPFTRFGTNLIATFFAVIALVVIVSAVGVYAQEADSEPVSEVVAQPTYANLPVQEQSEISTLVASTSVTVADAIKIAESHKDTKTLEKHLQSIDAYLGDIARTLHKIEAHNAI